MENELGVLTPAEIELVRQGRARANEQAIKERRVQDIMRKPAWQMTPEDTAFLRSQINEAVAAGDVRF
jgi:hypothetical protein